jgi:transducin (beta)-like 1
MTGNCTTGFSLLETHVCTLNPSLKPTVKLSVNSASVPAIMAAQPASAPELSDSQKRKASTPVVEEGHLDKRQRTAELDNIDVDEKHPDGQSTFLHCICVSPALRPLYLCAYTCTSVCFTKS